MIDDPADVLEPILAETKRVIEEMKNTKDLDIRKTQSEILQNLCNSASVFFDLISNAMLSDGWEDDWDGDEEEDEEGQ